MINRIGKIRNIISSEEVDGMLISSTPTIFYLTEFAHFSFEEREAFVLITKRKNYIITDTRYSEAVKQKVKGFELLEISSTSSLSDLFKTVAKKHLLKTVGFEPYNLSVSEYKFIKKCFRKLKEVNVSHIRIIKDTAEINAVQKACSIGDEAFTHILPFIKEGVTEKQLAFKLEHFIKEKGYDISFPTIVAFGKNAAIPHHGTSNEKLKRNNFVLFDFGVKADGYCSDMSRTVFFGKPTEEQEKMYQIVLEAQQKAIEYISSLRANAKQSQRSLHRSASRDDGLMANNVDQVARDYITKQGYPSIPHSLGHGTGIEVHEPPTLSPKSKHILKPGMIFSIEPGIYKPGYGGVRIEDLILLTNSGPRLLTKSPKELIQI